MESKKLIINSNLGELNQVYTWLKETFEPIISENLKNTILLIAYEIATNAILHGNESDENKLVHIELNISKSQIIVTIQDEGEGYISLPSKEEAHNMNYLDEGGRGLKLAVLKCHDIELDKNKIKLIFKR